MGFGRTESQGNEPYDDPEGDQQTVAKGCQDAV